MGEGYHNFHHQFPMDYRNAFHWYQYDPTKWFIALCNTLGWASSLRKFPYNEIQKGVLRMQLKGLKKLQDSLEWPAEPEDLPILTWDECAFLISSLASCSVADDVRPSPRSVQDAAAGFGVWIHT